MKSPYKGKFKVTQQYKGSEHDGLDLVGLDGKEIYSTISGTVEYAGWENPSDKTQGFGLYARIKESSSDDRYYFGHLSKINVKVGQVIAENQIIGIEGNTGNSTGSHCHYCARGNASKSQIRDISEISGIPNALGTYESTPDVYYLVKKSWKAETAYRTKYISQARIFAREHHYVIYDESGKTITSYRDSGETFYLVKKSWKNTTIYRTKYISQARILARSYSYVIYDETGKTITSYRKD